MRKQTHSILRDLFENQKDTSLEICESRADHVLNQVINLLEMVDGLKISNEEKQDLNKRIHLAIRNKDTNKFMRQMRKVRAKYESKP